MSRPKRTAALLLLLLPFWLGFSSADESRVSPLTGLLGKTVNFVILFGGLGFLLAKPLRKFLAEIGLSVEKTLQQTVKAKTDAEDRLESLQERMETLEQEVRKIKSDGEEAGRWEKERTLAQARQESEKIRSFAALEIQALAQSAAAELRERAAETAVSLARVSIERRLTPEFHSRLIDESIRSLGTLYEEPHSR
jgi:F0F1-type ATP synthase membrane subunit b/b'